MAFFSSHFRHGLENLASSSILIRQGDLACINANF
ncbi:cytoplasmic protein [Citrobacter rodentium]|nr:cytoplasmic protein [Citrobacter rodentium]